MTVEDILHLCFGNTQNVIPPINVSTDYSPYTEAEKKAIRTTKFIQDHTIKINKKEVMKVEDVYKLITEVI